jgi:hypothetical protein
VQAGKTIFDAWMLEESDHVQGLAHAYGDRVVTEAFANALRSADQENKPVLAKLKYATWSTRRMPGRALAALSPVRTGRSRVENA